MCGQSFATLQLILSAALGQSEGRNSISLMVWSFEYFHFVFMPSAFLLLEQA